MITVRNEFDTFQETSKAMLQMKNMKTLLPLICRQQQSAYQRNHELNIEFHRSHKKWENKEITEKRKQLKNKGKKEITEKSILTQKMKSTNANVQKLTNTYQKEQLEYCYGDISYHTPKWTRPT